MIRRYMFHITLAVVVILLFLAARHYKGGSDAMVAQVESQVMAISYQKPVLIKKIYVSPGQVVDSGDMLIEVERPDLALDMDRKLSEKYELERKLEEAKLNFEHSLKILDADYSRKTSQLKAEKKELEYELDLSRNRKKQIGNISPLTYTANDTLKLNDIRLINELLNSYAYQYEIQKQQLDERLQFSITQFQSELIIIGKEIAELEDESSKLVQKAIKAGTIGNLFVQHNELVPPYTTLLSVYDLNPNLIKAFISERAVEDLHIGSKVIVESVNKAYSIEGQIVEIGYRITSYPDKINPTIQQKSYGQEIFINIPDENNFLNGEKVYVYVIDN